MKRQARPTKRERKAAAPVRPTAPGGAAQPQQQGERHVHCVACGRHLDRAYFDPPATATVLTCQHNSPFAACTACVPKAQAMLAEHDRTGQPVKPAAVWH